MDEIYCLELNNLSYERDGCDVFIMRHRFSLNFSNIICESDYFYL